MTDPVPPPRPRPPIRWRDTTASPAEGGSAKLTRLVLLGLGLAVAVGVAVGLYIYAMRPGPPVTHFEYALVGLYEIPKDSLDRLLPTPWLSDDSLLIDQLPDQLPKNLDGHSQIVTESSRTSHSISREDFEKRIETVKDLLSKNAPDAPKPTSASARAPVIILCIAAVGVVKGGKPYLLPNDWRLGDGSDPKEKWVSVNALLDKLAEAKSPNLLLVLNWATPRYVGKRPPWDEVSFADGVSELLEQKQGQLPFHVITACSRGEESLPLAAEGKSVFGYFLTQGLRGDAARASGATKLTASQLADYLCGKDGQEGIVNQWALYNTGRTQHPRHYGPAGFDPVLVHTLAPPPGASPVKTPSGTEPGKPADSKSPPAADITRAALGENFETWHKGWKRYEDLQGPQLFAGLQAGQEDATLSLPSAQLLASPDVRRLTLALKRYEMLTLTHPSRDEANGMKLWTDELASALEKAPSPGSGPAPGAPPSDWVWSPESLPNRKELEDGLRAVAAAAGPDLKLDAFLNDPSVKKFPPQAAALCWQVVVGEEGPPVSEDLVEKKLIAMRGALRTLLRPDPSREPRELVVLNRVADFYGNPSYTPTDPGNKKYHSKMLAAVVSWLRVEHGAQMVARNCRLAGSLSKENAERIRQCDDHYQACTDVWAITETNRMPPSDDLVDTVAAKLERVRVEYANLNKDLQQGQVAGATYWTSIAQLEAAAGLALPGPSDAAVAWLNWAGEVKKLGDALKGTPTAEAISNQLLHVNRTRRLGLQAFRELLKPTLERFQKTTDPGAKPPEPGKPAIPPPVPSPRAIRDLQFALQADFWTVDQRITLIAALDEGRRRLHQAFQAETKQSPDVSPPPPEPDPKQEKQVRQYLDEFETTPASAGGAAAATVLQERKLPSWPPRP